MTDRIRTQADLDRLEAYLNDLPEEAQAAYHNGGTWEYKPESIEEGNSFPYYCDDCDAWHNVWYMPGYRIQNGKLYMTYDKCDTDGDWDFSDECEISDPAFPKWEAGYSFNESERCWREYYEYVRDEGEDPLGDFFVDDTVKHNWWFHITMDWVNGGCLLVGGAREDTPDQMVPPDELPKELLDYLCIRTVDGRKYVTECVHPDQLIEQVTELDWKGAGPDSVKALVEIREPRNEEEIREELSRKAEQVLSKRSGISAD